MANSEDVRIADLERGANREAGLFLSRDACCELRVLVRELRRDRARLDWMLFHGVMVMTSPEIWCDRAEIDAAMGGGEGEG